MVARVATGRLILGGDVADEATREAPVRAEPHPYPELRPPMVCVKLPKSVLGLFHLFRATKLPLFRIEVQADKSL